jgi:hypothetical protein
MIEDLSISPGIRGGEIKVYPNPVADAFTLQSDYSGTIQVYSVEGKAVMEPFGIRKGQHALNVSVLHPGVYILRMHTDKGIWQLKLVKK